ncbi:carbohydrate ABC transporter permease [Candidatus Galacturonibacter soehngenii]|uniref:Carbohydrate ABC transporter permease n=1 Tax=Candidatus Galacturonatibacter soehngenii TaxID=2307010 RepID=A0A7V7QMX2_9FIRM|nr:carbohydrate ABC transporter permease [Candidatus Galacturonibacter soehngenii]KAB1440079.1 carbohydrate ABC transporter permease [Candidatus Galacturonibacter soehngenii]MBA4686093.1 carbohydrate ABC transporter permease [Candidatus Galacturonibacter soehngenii]
MADLASYNNTKNKVTGNNKIKSSTGDRIVQILIYLIAGIVGIATLLPFLYVLAGSFATERELTEKAFFIIPTEISFNAYQYIVKTGEVFKGLKNSIFLTIVGTFIQMFFTTTFAYPLSKKHFKGRNLVLNLVIVTMLFSGGMIPTFLWIKQLGLYNSFWALMLMGAISPFNMIIVKKFFEDLPGELDEAARIDGANDLEIFYKVALPLSKPVIASISLFYAVGHWNDYFNAMIYLNNPAKETVQIVLRRIVLLTGKIEAEMMTYNTNGAPPDKAVKMAATVVATVPIIMIYPFVQQYFAQGVMVGAVKG